MKEANLSVPLFESDRAGNKFILTLLSHHFFDEKDIKWLSLLDLFRNYNPVPVPLPVPVPALSRLIGSLSHFSKN